MKTPIISALLAVVANLALTEASFYGPRDDVQELTPQNFGPAILDTDQLVAVEFYAPWCGHCQRLAPEWKKAATNLKGLVHVGAIDCDVESNKGICAMYEIQGFPTIKIFSPELKKNKKTGQMTKVPTDYQGPRDAKSIVDYLLSYQPSDVQFIKWNEKDVKSKKSVTLDSFLANNNETLPKAILFTNKPSTTPLYKALSVDFKDRMSVGEVKQSERNIVAEFGVDSFPTLVVISPEHGTVKFEGKLNRDSLFTFMDKYALPANDKNEKYKQQEKEAKKPFVAKEKQVQAIETDDHLSNHCLNRDNSNTICIVAITGDDDQQETIDILNALKKKESNKNAFDLQYMWIHASQANSVINTLQLSQDYPAMFMLHPNKQLFRNYVGSWSEKNLLNWVSQVGEGRMQAWTYQGKLKIDEKPEPIELPQEEENDDIPEKREPVRDEL